MPPVVLIGNICGIVLLYMLARNIQVFPDFSTMPPKILFLIVALCYMIASAVLVWFTLGRGSDISPLVHIVRFSAALIWFNAFFYFGSEALIALTGLSLIVAPIWAATTTLAFIIGPALVFGGFSMSISQVIGFVVMIIGLGILTSKDWIGLLDK